MCGRKTLWSILDQTHAHARERGSGFHATRCTNLVCVYVNQGYLRCRTVSLEKTTTPIPHGNEPGRHPAYLLNLLHASQSTCPPVHQVTVYVCVHVCRNNHTKCEPSPSSNSNLLWSCVYQISVCAVAQTCRVHIAGICYELVCTCSNIISSVCVVARTCKLSVYSRQMNQCMCTC